MCDCGSQNRAGAGPFASGLELVKFVLAAHGGTVASSPLPNGGLQATCQGCGASYRHVTFVQACPECGGVHAISPPRANDPNAIQFAGTGFVLTAARELQRLEGERPHISTTRSRTFFYPSDPG